MQDYADIWMQFLSLSRTLNALRILQVLFVYFLPISSLPTVWKAKRVLSGPRDRRVYFVWAFGLFSTGNSKVNELPDSEFACLDSLSVMLAWIENLSSRWYGP